MSALSLPLRKEGTAAKAGSQLSTVSSESDSLTAKALCCLFPFLCYRCVDSDLDVLG